mgnify:FL=1
MKKKPGSEQSKVKKVLSGILLKGAENNDQNAVGVWCPTLIFHQPKRPKLHKEQKSE